jgi:hypothetical protein
MEETLVGIVKDGEGKYVVGVSNLAEHIILSKVIMDQAKECGFIIKKDQDSLRVSPIEGNWSEEEAVENTKIVAACIKRGLRAIANCLTYE